MQAQQADLPGYGGGGRGVVPGHHSNLDTGRPCGPQRLGHRGCSAGSEVLPARGGSDASRARPVSPAIEPDAQGPGAAALPPPGPAARATPSPPVPLQGWKPVAASQSGNTLSGAPLTRRSDPTMTDFRRRTGSKAQRKSTASLRRAYRSPAGGPGIPAPPPSGPPPRSTAVRGRSVPWSAPPRRGQVAHRGTPPRPPAPPRWVVPVPSTVTCRPASRPRRPPSGSG